MPSTKNSSQAPPSAALISVHPGYAGKIISGEKNIEFRRIWAATEVNRLAIYATSPVKRIVALAEIGEVVRGSKTKLWQLAREKGGGISRRQLFAYLDGKKEAVALELSKKNQPLEAIDPYDFFGESFCAPQSFRYLTDEEWQGLLGKTEA